MYFFVRTSSPRPTFHLDMTPDERAIMVAHVAYWTDLARAGVSVVFGPVADEGGPYGIGVYRADDEEEMRRMLAADPANGLLELSLTPMADAVIGHTLAGCDGRDPGATRGGDPGRPR